MAFITFYNASNSDIEQLSAGLTGTDHHWEYVAGPLTQDNLLLESEMISVSCGNEVTRAVIDALPKLRMIAVRCHDASLVDLEAAGERDITVTYVPAELGDLHSTINRVTAESLIKYWYGETPYRVPSEPDEPGDPDIVSEAAAADTATTDAQNNSPEVCVDISEASEQPSGTTETQPLRIQVFEP